MLKINITNNLKDKLEGLGYSTETKFKIQQELRDNYRLVWSSRGSSIGSPWPSGVDLIESGELRNNMVNLSYANITENFITIDSGVAYGSYVNDKYVFMRISEDTLSRIAKLYIEPISEALR